jgi:Mg-chelatase subunit ChlD
MRDGRRGSTRCGSQESRPAHAGLDAVYRVAGLRGAALLAAAISAAAMLHAQAPDVTVVFASPVDGGYASGPMPIHVRIEPAGAAVTSVSLFADGRLICTLNQPPFECQWDAGPKVVEHVMRARAILTDGRSIVQSIRTKGVSYIESVDVDVVHVTATVTDGDRRFTRGLRRQDFQVYEDGVLQDLTTFLAEDVPLEIIVAVDVSGSMTDAMPKVKESVKRFLSALKPKDRVTILGFNDSVFTLARPTVDLVTRLKAIDRLAPWGGTALYDVIVQAIDLLGRQTGRRVLVVFTDGEDLNSRVPIEVAERRLETSDAVVYPIGQGPEPAESQVRPGTPGAQERGTGALRRQRQQARRRLHRHSRRTLESVPAGLRAEEPGSGRAVADAVRQGAGEGPPGPGKAGLPCIAPIGRGPDRSR